MLDDINIKTKQSVPHRDGLVASQDNVSLYLKDLETPGTKSDFRYVRIIQNTAQSEESLLPNLLSQHANIFLLCGLTTGIWVSRIGQEGHHTPTELQALLIFATFFRSRSYSFLSSLLLLILPPEAPELNPGFEENSN